MMKAAENARKKLPLRMAIKHVEEKMNISPNGGFMSKLVALERDLFGEVGIFSVGLSVVIVLIMTPLSLRSFVTRLGSHMVSFTAIHSLPLPFINCV